MPQQSGLGLPCNVLCHPGTQRTSCSSVVSLSFSQNRHCVVVSWDKTLLYTRAFCSLTARSPDAPVPTPALLAASGICILEIGEGSQISSRLAPGRFPCSGSPSPRHFMTHLWSFIPHGEGLLALDLCSICSSPFPAKVAVSPKENKRCSDSLVNFCMWDE